MKRLAILALLALPGCEDPALGLGATFDSGGVSVSRSSPAGSEMSAWR